MTQALYAHMNNKIKKIHTMQKKKLGIMTLQKTGNYPKILIFFFTSQKNATVQASELRAHWWGENQKRQGHFLQRVVYFHVPYSKHEHKPDLSLVHCTCCKHMAKQKENMHCALSAQ
jgi:hypothetical protein